jgi:hypothetical protein
MSHVKRTIPLSLFIFLSSIAVLGQQQPAAHPEAGTWVTVAPANAGFTALMPAKPAEKVTPVEGRPGVENYLMTLETELAGYVLSYVQFPEEVTEPGAIKEMLDRGREGGIAASGGELKSEKEIKLNSYFGREWLMQLPGGYFGTVRAYWVKRRLYQTVFVTTPKASDSPEIIKLRREAEIKFLDSFALSADTPPK